MKHIDTHYDHAKSLTTFTATGKMTVDDFHDFLERYYVGQVTRFILWDLTRADLSAFKTADIKEVAQCIVRISEARRGGKTAFVYDQSLEFGIGRMFQAYSQMADMPFEVQAFKSLVEAKAWLGA